MINNSTQEIDKSTSRLFVSRDLGGRHTKEESDRVTLFAFLLPVPEQPRGTLHPFLDECISVEFFEVESENKK